MAPPHFDISAAVVRQLGEELVSDEVTAIVELVKNAYDADATYAHVVVETNAVPNPESKFPQARGQITIEDDGMGMDLLGVERGWLTISLSAKRDMKATGSTTPKGRTPLGDKGLGRLSTQKLGNNLEMYTRKERAPERLHVSFAWSEFTDEKSLSQVPVSIESAAQGDPQKGTLLSITGLRNPEVWKGDAAEQLVTDLSQIISPFPEARPFRVTLRIDGRPVDLGQISERVRNAAVGRFKFKYENERLSLEGRIRLAKLRGNRIDDIQFFEERIAVDNGRTFFGYLATKKAPVAVRFSKDTAYFLEFDYRTDLRALGQVEKVAGEDGRDSSALADPGPFRGEIDEYVLRGDESGLKLSGLANASEVQQIVKRHAGVKVFRDGFAIKPYGINGQDWLKLSAQQTSATSWYGLRPHNVIGFVAITEAANSRLREKTDREGFVSNPWSQNFQRLMIHNVDTIGNLHDWLRRNYNTYKRDLSVTARSLDSSRQVAVDADTVARKLSSYRDRAKSLAARTSSAREKIAVVARRIKEAPVLASTAERELLGLLNDARQSFEASDAILAELEDYAAQAKDLAQIVATLTPRLDVLNDQLQDFSELAGLGLLAETLSHEVQNQTDRLMQRASLANAKARKFPQNSDLLHFSQEVTSAASALRRQIGHLTPSLRYQRDKIEIFGLAALLRDIRGHFLERWRSDTFAGQIVTEGDDFQVETNRGRLTQVIDNIVLNSEYWLRQALGRDKRFRPIIKITYGSPRLCVSDNGPGVDASVEDVLFEPFISLKPKHQGRGLGLFISAQILESIGCTISLLAERNGQGHRHIFELDLSGIVHGK